MSDALSIQRRSAAGSTAMRNAEPLCMLIDTTTCIGCKACEAACVEWNDLCSEPGPEARPLHSYQTLPDMTPAFWNLIRFSEIPVDAQRRPAADGPGVMMLLRKDMCLHCAEPGCLLACPAEGAVVQYTSGIVDFQQDRCIGCGLCMTGCPFGVPKLDPRTQRVYKCTLCVDRVESGLGPACVKACPTGCLEFGTKAAMRARAEQRAEQVREEGFPQAGVYDPPGVGGTGVIYVLHHADRPELYGGLPREPRLEAVRIWRGPLRWLGGASLVASMVAAALHWLLVGARRVPAVRDAAAERELVRYSLGERLLHWSMALSFLYLALSGLGLYAPSFSWLLVLLGGGQGARAWHPVVGVLFTSAVSMQFLLWLRDLRLSTMDWAWLRRMRDYVAGRDEGLPPTGRFNGGQKLLFHGQVALAWLLFASGVPLWFPQLFSRAVRLAAVVSHSLCAVLALVSLVVHVHMAVFVTRGALRAMLEGKVSEGWARHHHSAWADDQLGPRT